MFLETHNKILKVIETKRVLLVCSQMYSSDRPQIMSTYSRRELSIAAQFSPVPPFGSVPLQDMTLLIKELLILKRELSVSHLQNPSTAKSVEPA